MFQSTPVIANGRIPSAPASSAKKIRFQSTPVIANGRINLTSRTSVLISGFNPRPLLLTGESWLGNPDILTPLVSIHARYC